MDGSNRARRKALAITLTAVSLTTLGAVLLGGVYAFTNASEVGLILQIALIWVAGLTGFGAFALWLRLFATKEHWRAAEDSGEAVRGPRAKRRRERKRAA